MSQPEDLAARLLRQLRALGVGREPTHLLVAVSGGCDSVVLLHLLRFALPSLPLRLSAAHLDHAMRPGSPGDARWVAGLCRAWEVPLVEHRLERAPGGEAEARRLRYEFLRRAARECGAALVATAHHADDQAETVLFRALRGTGVAGLAGIPARTRSGVVRPLLPFWRRELEAYARLAGLRWREDPTNQSLDPARNWIRHRLLPLAERHVAPAARRNLVSLAELAREAERGWSGPVRAAERDVVTAEDGAFLLARSRLRGYDSAIGSRILRRLLRRFGVVPSRAGTRAALQFITDAASGREMELPGGVRVRIEFEHARVERAPEPPPDLPLRIAEPPTGSPRQERVRLAGREYRVWLGAADAGGNADPGAWSVALDPASVRFPLLLRARAPGDRVATSGGTKPLKKLFVEERVPRSVRERLPVLVDAAGDVLWVAGLRRRFSRLSREGSDLLVLTIVHV